MYETLEKLLQKRNMSKYALAKAAGIAHCDIYSLFKGSRPLFPNWKKRICNALEMDESEVFPELVEEDQSKTDK